MLDVLLSGAIFSAPVQRTGQSGKTFVTTKIKAATSDGDVFANVIAFSDTACRALLALAAGDSVAITGPLKLGTYQASNGDTRVSIDLVASQVMTVYSVKRKRDKVLGDGSDTEPARPPAGRTGHSSSPRHGNAPSGRAFDQWHAAQLPADDFADLGDVL